MTKPILLTLAILGLSACALTPDKELPVTSPNGSDRMKESPCACTELPYSRDFIRKVAS